MIDPNEPTGVLVALRRIIRATDKNSKRLSRSTGLTVPQIVLMRAIDAHPGATLGFLTSLISLSQATVTTILDRLEDRGLAVRSRNEQDKRVVNVVLTPSGKQLLDDSPPPLQEEFGRRFEALAVSQQTVIINALEAVADMMGAGSIDAAPILTLGQLPEVAVASGDAALPLPDVQLRAPVATDGHKVHALVRACPPLDQNSLYCNLLQCSHFAETAVVAERAGVLIGAISAYRLPARPDTLFVWQVAVHADARRMGLGKRMLDNLLQRTFPLGVRFIETSVTADNANSSAMFKSFVGQYGAKLVREPLFERDQHFKGAHDTEWLLRMGPFPEAGVAVRRQSAAAVSAEAATRAAS